VQSCPKEWTHSEVSVQIIYLFVFITLTEKHIAPGHSDGGVNTGRSDEHIVAPFGRYGHWLPPGAAMGKRPIKSIVEISLSRCMEL
jgi:hypothetical protein